jgi:hypothetical protein
MFSFLASLLLLAAPAHAFDHAAFGGLLAKDVSAGRVDYAAVRADRATLDGYLAAVAAAKGDQPLGFWINAYNALVLHALAAEPTLPAQVTDLPGFFDTRTYTVAGKSFTLNALEASIRAKGDPRVHFALNCGARSCPPLQGTAYAEDPGALSAQLEKATRAFLDGAGVVADGRHVRVTKLFDWYAQDFVTATGRVPNFLYAHLGDLAKLAAVKAALGKGAALEYLPYDWTVNAL